MSFKNIDLQYFSQIIIISIYSFLMLAFNVRRKKRVKVTLVAQLALKLPMNISQGLFDYEKSRGKISNESIYIT